MIIMTLPLLQDLQMAWRCLNSYVTYVGQEQGEETYASLAMDRGVAMEVSQIYTYIYINNVYINNIYI